MFDRLERNIVLLNLAVHPKYRGNGVGVTLIEAVKQLTERLLPLVERIARKEGLEVGTV